MRQKCYLSYDWSNKPSITYILELFKYNIEKLSFNAVRVIWDEDFHNGENYKEKEKEIRECDSVIIFATPEYKQSVEEADENRGVYREYKYILETKNTKGIKVLCVLISGKVKEAIPREFRDDIAADFSAHQFYYTNKRGRHYVSKEYKNSFRNFITDIIYETEQSSRRKEYHFASKEEAYRTMFVETEDKRKLPREAMFKPEIYTDIFEGIASGVVVGRKGSGKTTLFSVLENYDRERFDRCFKVLRPISAEFIKESYIYNYYQEFSNDVIALEANDILVLFGRFICIYAHYILYALRRKRIA